MSRLSCAGFPVTTAGVSAVTVRRWRALQAESCAVYWASADRSTRAVAQVKPGVYHGRWDHASLLRTIEDAFRLPHLRDAKTARSTAAIWR